MAERIYIATPTDPSQPERLVVASNPAQVSQHLARHGWNVAAAGAMEVANAMTAGARPETAGEPVQDERQEVLPGLSD